MKVNEFIEKFNKLKNDEERTAFLKERVKETYIDFERKIDMCEKIIKNTSYSEISEDTVVWKKRYAMEYLFYTINLITTYTDVEFEEGNVMKGFNDLNKLYINYSGSYMSYINIILSVIPQTEVAEFSFVLNLCKDDQESNERNLTGAIIDLLSLLGNVGNDKAELEPVIE